MDAFKANGDEDDEDDISGVNISMQSTAPAPAGGRAAQRSTGEP